LVDKKTKKILATDFSHGKKHDFKQFKEMQIRIISMTKILADSGYQGLQLLYKNGKTPIKSSKHKPLTKWQKLYNKIISSRRVAVENIIRCIKIFRILAEKI
jgi:hypothetical protein